MALLLKTASVRVSSIQIMQVRVRNKGKSVWKSRYDGDVSVYFTSVHSIPWVFDTGSVAKICNSEQGLQNEQILVKGEVTMCVGSDSKVDKITIAHSLHFRD